MTHFNPEKPIVLQTDASGFGIAGILNQFDDFGVLRPVAFTSRKCSPAEQNYDTYDRELLAIVESFKAWRHYLEGAAHTVLVRCDHKNLVYFTSTKVLSRRQARWAVILSAYDFTIEHLEGTKNPADGPSRRPDYEAGYERPAMQLLGTKESIEQQLSPYDELMQEILTAQQQDPKLVSDSTVNPGVLTQEGRISIPNDAALQAKIIRLFHDSPESGYFGIAKTAELVSRDFYWPRLEQSVRKYVLACELCHRIKAPRHRKHGVNMPIEPPSQPWEGLTKDFLTDFPPSVRIDIANSYTGILVVVY